MHKFLAIALLLAAGLVVGCKPKDEAPATTPAPVPETTEAPAP
jgi:hypothetical protein